MYFPDKFYVSRASHTESRIIQYVIGNMVPYGTDKQTEKTIKNAEDWASTRSRRHGVTPLEHIVIESMSKVNTYLFKMQFLY